jgi:hypothetical protein
MRYFLTTLCLLCLLSVRASDLLPIAVWSMGPGTIAGSTAQPQHAVLQGQMMASSASLPARLDFISPVVGHITLSPGAEIKLRVEQNDGQQLILDVLQGAVQVQLDDKGPYVAMHVRGGALDVRVTGTLFVVERVRRDADYVALIQGKLKVGLKKDVADALGKAGQLELESRQGVGGDANGLASVEGLNNRPQIASASRSSIQGQSTGPIVGDGGWDDDMALSFLLDLLEQLGLDDAILAQFTDALADALFDDLNTGPAEQVLSTAFSSAGVLGSPPPPPPFTP